MVKHLHISLFRCKKVPIDIWCNIAQLDHNHATRNRHISFEVKIHGSKAFKYNGIKLWNDLPCNIRESNIKEDFKSKCKKCQLFNQMNAEAKYVFTV